PPKLPPRCCFLETRSCFALTLDRRLNQTILECADWGQITVSYTVLPFRRSCVRPRPTTLSTPLAAPKKYRQINFLAPVRDCDSGPNGTLLTQTARRLGEPAQQSEFTGRRIGRRLLVHARARLCPLRCLRRAGDGAVGLLGRQRKILQNGKAIAVMARAGGAPRRLAATEPRRSLLDQD